jgi:hypothetical protein
MLHLFERRLAKFRQSRNRNAVYPKALQASPGISASVLQNKSHAIESSLWELQALQNHILPSIATAAKFINMPLPSIEWDMSKILENSADDVSKASVTDLHQIVYFLVVKWVLFIVILYVLKSDA